MVFLCRADKNLVNPMTIHINDFEPEIVELKMGASGGNGAELVDHKAPHRLISYPVFIRQIIQVKSSLNSSTGSKPSIR